MGNSHVPGNSYVLVFSRSMYIVRVLRASELV